MMGACLLSEVQLTDYKTSGDVTAARLTLMHCVASLIAESKVSGGSAVSFSDRLLAELAHVSDAAQRMIL